MISLQRRFVLFSISILGINGIFHVCFQLLLSRLPWSREVYLSVYIFLSLMLIIGSGLWTLWNSRKISYSVQLLSKKLTAMARGERDILFSQNSTFELQEIVRAAEVLQYELMNREKERRQWTQDITHDLRTPITAIKTQLQAVHDGVFLLDEDRYNLLFRELGIVEKMVQDFALLSRIESPEMHLHERWISGPQLLKNLVSRFTALAHENEVDLKEQAANFYFKADENLLIRAASNLVQNAFQHTPKGGTISIELKIRKNQILLRIENPGTIPDEDLPHIFQRLYRGEKSRTSSGSGLGLTIAKSIAQLHRGDVTAQNSSRKTTLFEMTINMAF